jgi:hypothetical protein
MPGQSSSGEIDWFSFLENQSSRSPQCMKVSLIKRLKGINTYLGIIFSLRVARFFLAHDTKTRKIYQMNTECTKCSWNIPKVRNVLQMDIKYINNFQSKALQNLPQLEFLLENKPSGNPGKQTACR